MTRQREQARAELGEALAQLRGLILRSALHCSVENQGRRIETDGNQVARGQRTRVIIQGGAAPQPAEDGDQRQHLDRAVRLDESSSRENFRKHAVFGRRIYACTDSHDKVARDLPPAATAEVAGVQPDSQQTDRGTDQLQ
jgi:hypothetical protein